MTKAYVETTILTDALLKPKSAKCGRARAALARYDQTLLPVYAIKEWKAGPLNTFAYVHDKLVSTHSLHRTLDALSVLRGYKLSTGVEALAAAQAPRPGPRTVVAGSTEDQRSADRVRLALRSLIIRSWRTRRKITSDVIQDLPCYTEAEPQIGKYGFFDLAPMKCEAEIECSLASALKARPDLLEALRNAIPESSTRLEDRNRRKALKSLIHRPKAPLDRDSCRALGDAVFAFFCPSDAVVLTTNIKDHSQLAEAIGKTATTP